MAGSCGAFCGFCGKCGKKIPDFMRANKPDNVPPPGVNALPDDNADLHGEDRPEGNESSDGSRAPSI